MNWIGNVRPEARWRSIAARLGVHFIAISLVGFGLVFAFIAIAVSSPAQQREWLETSKSFTLKSAEKTVSLTKEQEEQMIRFNSISSGAITFAASGLGLSLGFGLLFAKR